MSSVKVNVTLMFEMSRLLVLRRIEKLPVSASIYSSKLRLLNAPIVS